MINAVFIAEIENGAGKDPVKRFKSVRSFEISDHSGVSSAGSDILCAAVSSMTMLTVNTLDEFFHIGLTADAADTSEGGMPCVRVRISPEYVSSKEVTAVVSAFYNELLQLKEEYPRNLRLEVKNSERKDYA